MSTAMFYQLRDKTLIDTLRMLLEKSLAAGWHVAVRGTQDIGLQALDKALWLGPEGSFLPHGMAGGDHDAEQPVLLGTALQTPNNARCIIAIQRADVTPADVAAMERVCILFDGYDEDELAHARGQWSALKSAGVTAQYWAEDDGRWVKKAET